MELNAKAAHRKSRAPWAPSGAGGQKINNPYANANMHDEFADGNSNTYNSSGRNPYGDVNHDSSNPYGVNEAGQGSNATGGRSANSRKNTRRLSIHASATAAAHAKNFMDPSNLPPVPPLGMGGDNASIGLGQKNKHTEDPNDVATKITNDLSNATAGEIDEYYKVLVKNKAVVTRDIKDNINQNQKNIIELMSDLKSTQDELLQLRISTKDLYEVLDLFKESAERRLALEDKHGDARSPYSQNGGQKNSRHKDRSSIIALEKIWANELLSLFKHVEGASKMIHGIPGRHVIAESGRWFEVNIGNWKATKAIHIFILNDLVLVATKKSSSSNNQIKSKSRLQAVHCWSLHDLQLQVVSSKNKAAEADNVYLINITCKSFSYMYQTDRYDHFLKITEAFNKGKTELLQKDRLIDVRKSINGDDGFEPDDEKRQLRESLRNSGIIEGVEDNGNPKRRSGSQRHSADILLQDISARVHSRNRSHDFSSSGKFSNFSKDDKGQFFMELRRIEERLDEVDIEIAHNRFHEAVGLIGYIENKLDNVENIIMKNNSNDAETIASMDEIKLLVDVIKLKINNRRLKVQQALSFNLQHNISKLSTQQLAEILEFFYTFGVLDKGIDIFLGAVSSDLSNTVSKLVVSVQGSTKTDVMNYLSNLVIIDVSIMKKTISTYKKCIFPILERDNEGNVDSSGLVNWCIEEGNKLLESLKKQLLGTLIVPEDINDDDNDNFIIKDVPLYRAFLDVLRPQLDDLKTVGINIDYLFDDLLTA